MRLGRTRLADRAPGEVRYYSPPGQALQPSVFVGEGYVPFAYGGFYMEAMDAHGGWLATAADLVRFATAVDGQRGSALLRPDTVDLMLHAPIPVSPDAGGAGAGNERAASGLGWVVQQDAGGLSWSHAGALEGSTASWLLRRPDGLTVAWVFNTLPEDNGGFFQAAIPATMAAIDAVSVWPTHDLFAAP
jgi:N-acyl-D-amino-acid deacylase